MSDVIVKKLFSSENGQKYLAKVICTVLNMPEDSVSFKVIHPDIGINKNVINSQADLVLESDEALVNVEVNCYNSRLLQNKNNSYICHLILKQTRTDKDYKVKLKKVYQINLNAFDITKDDRFVVISRLVDTKTHQEIHPFLEIVDVNLAKIIKTSYTSVKEKESLEKLLYLLVCNDEQVLRNVYDGDDLMEKMVDEAKSLTSDFDSMLYYDAEALKDASSYELGEETGRNEEKKSIVVNMIKENADISFIARVSGLSIEEIEDIKKEMNL
mgnify:FL=1